MTYAEKLRDPRWRELRQFILNRDNYTCTCCGTTAAPLEIHHTWYMRNLEPWEYEAESLFTVCRECHQATHDDMQPLYKELSRLNPNDVMAAHQAIRTINQKRNPPAEESIYESGMVVLGGSR